MRTTTSIPPPRWTIPPYESGRAVVARLAPIIRPRRPLTVSQWAQENTGYDPDVMPWQVEVMDALSDPPTAEVGLMGPAQGGKSEIGLNWIGWTIDHDPTDMLLCQPDKTMAQDFVERRVDPLIDKTASLKASLAPVANANNIFQKKFRGMLLTTIWPVAAQFAARPIARGWIDDYDQIDADIEGQGSAVKLLDGRQTTFEGRDTKFVSSSPADDEGGKIEAFIAGGTDERLQPVCPSCQERFEPDLLRDLRFDRSGSPDQAEASAHVVCPVNGCVLPPSDRRALLASLAGLPAHGFVAVNDRASKRRRSFRLDGLLAFTSWPKLAREWREAEIAWETRQDEADLRTFVNTRAGKNYRAKATGEKPLEAVDLAKRLEPGWKSGQVPAGVRVIVVAVDVQHDRFEVLVLGYGENLESWPISRYAIDVLPDGLTTLRPFRNPEHWQVLLPLFTKEWRLADGSGRSVPALTVAIDTGGADQAGDDSALKFWHAARALGIHPSRITLLKGASRATAPLMAPAQFSDRKTGGGVKRNGPKLFLAGVHKIKGIIDNRLRRDSAGPGFIHLPEWLAPKLEGRGAGRDLQYLEELTAERLIKGKWQKLRPRNETWDLLVYAYAAILRPPFAQSRAHMRWVPEAFRVPDPIERLPGAVVDDDVTDMAPAPAPLAPRARAEPVRVPAATPWIDTGGGDWI